MKSNSVTLKRAPDPVSKHKLAASDFCNMPDDHQHLIGILIRLGVMQYENHTAYMSPAYKFSNDWFMKGHIR